MANKKSFDIDIDDKDVQQGLDRLGSMFDKAERDLLMQLADTLLTLSRFEVPHDTGNLQKHGSVFFDSQGSGVAYNTAYAAYQHEGVRRDGTHKITNWQKGRKGKYLEDPLKMNMSKWENIIEEVFGNLLKS